MPRRNYKGSSSQSGAPSAKRGSKRRCSSSRSRSKGSKSRGSSSCSPSSRPARKKERVDKQPVKKNKGEPSSAKKDKKGTFVSERKEERDPKTEKRALAVQKEMLAEKIEQRSNAKDDAEVCELHTDIEILKGLIREKERLVVQEATTKKTENELSKTKKDKKVVEEAKREKADTENNRKDKKEKKGASKERQKPSTSKDQQHKDTHKDQPKNSGSKDQQKNPKKAELNAGDPPASSDATSLQEQLASAPQSVEEAPGPQNADQPDEDPETKLGRSIASLSEMLQERLKEQLAAQNDAQVLELEGDIGILRGLVGEKEQELKRLASEREEVLKKETARRKEQELADEQERLKEAARRKEQELADERDKLKQMLMEREKQKQQEEEERERQKLRAQEEEAKELELEREQLIAEEKERKEAEIREPHILPPPEADPPCDLPIWCVMPSRQDIVNDVELVRLCASSQAVLKRVWFARRSWALFGRRPPPGVTQGPKPDIGLAAVRASRSHAVLLRNWLGQVFLMDVGSPNGTFMDNVKLKPNMPVEWKVGAAVYFGEATPEVFELRLWKAPS